MLQKARQRAGALRISLAEYVRQLIARDLGADAGGNDVGAVFDLGGSGGSDVARNKDAMIAEALGRGGA